MSKEVPQVPLETGEGRGIDRKDRVGKHIIDNPIRVKSCKKCWQPLIIKSNKLYCEQCERFRNAKTTCWIDTLTKIEYLTPLELAEMFKNARTHS